MEGAPTGRIPRRSEEQDRHGGKRRHDRTWKPTAIKPPPGASPRRELLVSGRCPPTAKNARGLRVPAKTMTKIRTLAVHQVVEHVHPRPPRSDADEIAIVVGRAIDGAQAELSRAARQGRRVSQAQVDALTDSILRDGLEEVGIALDERVRTAELARIRRVVRAFRGSEVFGLGRPRSRLIVINGAVGIYAQPDYSDGRSRIYELKSYRPDPVPPAVALQVRYFQLAFPGFEAVLIGLDRHAEPVAIATTAVPAPTAEERDAALSTAYHLALERGEEKVLEYLDAPKTYYMLDVRPGNPSRPTPPTDPG
jgi:hypothetical protein